MSRGGHRSFDREAGQARGYDRDPVYEDPLYEEPLTAYDRRPRRRRGAPVGGDDGDGSAPSTTKVVSLMITSVIGSVVGAIVISRFFPGGAIIGAAIAPIFTVFANQVFAPKLEKGLKLGGQAVTEGLASAITGPVTEERGRRRRTRQPRDLARPRRTGRGERRFAGAWGRLRGMSRRQVLISLGVAAAAFAVVLVLLLGFQAATGKSLNEVGPTFSSASDDESSDERNSDDNDKESQGPTNASGPAGPSSSGGPSGPSGISGPSGPSGQNGPTGGVGPQPSPQPPPPSPTPTPSPSPSPTPAPSPPPPSERSGDDGASEYDAGGIGDSG